MSCFPFIFPALPLQGLQALFSHHFPAGCSELFLGSPTDPKAKISLLNFLSEFSKFSLELSILPAKRRKSTHSSLEWVSPQCFQHTLFCQEGLQGMHQSTQYLQPPALSLLENNLHAEWETIESIFFFQMVQAG